RAVLHLGIELLRHEQHPLELERKRHHTRDASVLTAARAEEFEVRPVAGLGGVGD
ncbi:hypothetical protein ABH936_002794, partial [Dermacoccus sp. GAS27A]